MHRKWWTLLAASVATFSGALVLLVLALVHGNAEGWASILIVSLFVGSAALLVAFIAIERRVSEPMLPVGLFRRPSFTGVQLASFAVSGSLLAMFLYLTLYLQNDLGYAPLAAGLRYLPIALLAFLFGPIAGAPLSRVPARLLLAGTPAAGDPRPRARRGRLVGRPASCPHGGQEMVSASDAPVVGAAPAGTVWGHCDRACAGAVSL